MKLGSGDYHLRENSIREQDPLKQGLKHLKSVNINKLNELIREQDPLKQGLKHIHKITNPDVSGIEIREQDPLKQGLKHKSIRL